MSTFATSPAVGPTDALEALLATTPMSEATGRAINVNLGRVYAQLDAIRRYVAMAVDVLPTDLEDFPEPMIGA